MGWLNGMKTDDDVLKKFNIFEGIRCEVTFPEKEVKIKSHGNLMRGMATMGYGLVGLAMTSGVKVTKEYVKMKTIFQVVPNGIVLKHAAESEKDLRIPWDNIVKLDDNGKYAKELKLILLENQILKIKLDIHRGKHRQIVYDHLLSYVAENATGGENEERGWGL